MEKTLIEELGEELKEDYRKKHPKKVENEDYALYGNIDQITGKPTFVGTREGCENELNRKSAIEILRENYELIKETLEIYLDMKQEYYSLIALWILGTYMHSDFDSYPYLFFNAMRGSGKSRILRLICELSKEGNVMVSPTEAVLFRTNGTLGIDEFEGVAKKDKDSIRELLNGAYKRGIKIMRMKKKKVLGQEEQVVEEFEPYRPIVMANICGMNEVLEDRCITIILEKSDHPIKTRLTEDFKTNPKIQKIKQNLQNSCSYDSLCSLCSKKNLCIEWNNYIINRYNNTLTTQHTLHTLNTLNTLTTLNSIKLNELFNKIHDSMIIGRNLELFLPIFLIANFIGVNILEETIKFTVDIINTKKQEEEIESVDVMVIDFISRQDEGLVWYSIKDLTNHFKEFSDEVEEWMNPKWFGRALKRLNLANEKRRKSYGVEVILNIIKAKEKLKIFQKPKTI